MMIQSTPRRNTWRAAVKNGWPTMFVLRCLSMASRSVNKVILIGHLGKDAETKFTTSGVAMSRFTLATNRRLKDSQTGEWKDETDWHNVIVWRQENLAQYLTKGKQIYVEGRLQTRSYEDKDGQKRYMTEVVAEEVFLLGGRGEGFGGGDEAGESRSRGPAPRAQSVKPAAAEPDFSPGITDDDVPF
jgi:single-strand DNA-binding protein